MKILICSDIHGNYEALKTLSTYIKDVDKKICLGDIVGYGYAVNECIDYLRDNEFICIQGNHDRYLIEGMDDQKKQLNESVRFGIQIADKEVTNENLKWLENLPVSIGSIFGGERMLFVHGSPFDPTDEYIYSNSFDSERFKTLRYDVIALGHTHRIFTYLSKEQLIFNPGSVGQARDFEGKVCFAILNTENQSLERVEQSYNVERFLNEMKSRGAGEWLFKHFKRYQ